jgi:hypothetical protein
MWFREGGKGFVKTRKLGVSERTMRRSHSGVSMCFILDVGTIPSPRLLAPENRKPILSYTLLFTCSVHQAK